MDNSSSIPSYAVWRSIGGYLVTLQDGHVRIGDALADQLRVPVVILDAAELPEYLARGPSQDLVLVHYPGRRRHPAGMHAPVSWVNDEGEGLLRYDAPSSLVVLPLEGAMANPHLDLDPAAKGGKRGPTATSDLWMILGGMAIGDWFDTALISQLTNISTTSARPALQRLKDLGLLEIRQSLDDRRFYRYRVLFDDPEALYEYLLARWRSWRGGAGTRAHKALTYFFSASTPWRLLGVSTKGWAVWPTGMTYLEGGPGALPEPQLMSDGVQPVLDLLVTSEHFEELRGILGGPFSEGSTGGQSRVTVVDQSHPLRRCLAHGSRLVHGCIAALDALGHQDERVIQEGRRVLRRCLHDLRHRWEEKIHG